MILCQDYVDEMTWDVEGVGYLEKEEGNGEIEGKKVNGGPKTREIVVHALSKSIEEG